MIETIFGSNTLASPTAFLSALIIGIAFGWCLEQAGMGSSRKLSAIFYFRDMTVLKVMLSAIITAILGLGILIGTGIINIASIFVPDTILGAQIVGGLLFGIGFAMGGWCPGTATVGAASGRIDAVFFIVGAILGSYIFNLSFDYLGFWYSWGNLGTSFAYNELGFRYADFTLLITIAAVFVFWFAELIEEKFSFAAVAVRSSGLWVFSVVVLLGGCLVMAMGRAPGATASVLNNGIRTADILQQIESGQEHIEPEMLAREMLLGQKRIVVADIRSPEEFDLWHIPGAVNVPVQSLTQGLERYRGHDKIVLCSNVTTRSAKAWIVVKTAGFSNACVLSGGLVSFFEKVLQPASLRNEKLTDQQKNEINQWRAMFLGSGMTAGAAEPVKSTQPVQDGF